VGALKKYLAQCWWLTPAILATQETEIRRITVRSQPRQIVPGDPISKKTLCQKVAEGVGPEFKPQCHKKRKRKKKYLSEDR
jgi:hypothetical protein